MAVYSRAQHSLLPKPPTHSSPTPFLTLLWRQTTLRSRTCLECLRVSTLQFRRSPGVGRQRGRRPDETPKARRPAWSGSVCPKISGGSRHRSSERGSRVSRLHAYSSTFGKFPQLLEVSLLGVGTVLRLERESRSIAEGKQQIRSPPIQTQLYIPETWYIIPGTDVLTRYKVS